MCRNLTPEGKILIVKTFGLSQLIYNLQCYPILDKDISNIEKLIFKFIWSRDWSKGRACDRIKRSVLKNDYNEGGLNVTDVECLNKAVKLRQYLRACESGHPISTIQKYCMEQLGYDNKIELEYSRITSKEEITRMAQITNNVLCDKNIQISVYVL